MKYCECCFIKMVPVKIYVVLTPPRLIFGPNLSDTLIILPTHSLTAFYTSEAGKSSLKSIGPEHLSLIII